MVENANRRFVRHLVGDVRYEGAAARDAINELYAVARDLVNFFTATMRLTEKRRVGGNVTRRYDEPRERRTSASSSRGGSSRTWSGDWRLGSCVDSSPVQPRWCLPERRCRTRSPGREGPHSPYIGTDLWRGRSQDSNSVKEADRIIGSDTKISARASEPCCRTGGQRRRTRCKSTPAPRCSRGPAHLMVAPRTYEQRASGTVAINA